MSKNKTPEQKFLERIIKECELFEKEIEQESYSKSIFVITVEDLQGMAETWTNKALTKKQLRRAREALRGGSDEAYERLMGVYDSVILYARDSTDK